MERRIKMGNIAKKILSVLIIFSLFSLSTSVFAKDTKLGESTNKEQTSLLQLENILDKELKSNNTDVVSQLNKQIVQLKNEQKSATSQEDSNKISDIISTTELLIDEYNKSKNNQAPGITTQVVSDPSSAAVTYALTYFSINGYNLAYELLSHARSNKILDSSYIPYYGYLVKQSPSYDTIRYGSSSYGSGEFKKQGNTVQMDLYWAMHYFVYSKDARNQYIHIDDRYDFARESYGSIGSVVIGLMVEAQNFGILTPYYTQIGFYY
jgi:hypothetical protein